MRHRKHRFLYSLAVLVIIFGAAEIVIRHFGLDRASEEKFYEDVFDPLTRMVPGAANPYTDLAEFMNPRGLRGPDFQKKKAPGVFRIVCLGDSTTFGMGDYGNSYPRVLDSLLNEGLDRKKFEVINAAIPGTNIYQQRLHFARLFKDTDLNLLILMTGPNYRKDLKLFRDKMKTPLYRSLMGAQHALKHSAVYRFMRLRLKGKPAVRVRDDSELKPGDELTQDIVTADYMEDLGIMRDFSEKMGFKLVFMRTVSQPYIEHLREMGLRPEQEDYFRKAAGAHVDQTFVFFARKWKLPVIDISQDFVPYDPKTPQLWLDVVHPGNLGNRLIAARVVSELRRQGLIPGS